MQKTAPYDLFTTIPGLSSDSRRSIDAAMSLHQYHRGTPLPPIRVLCPAGIYALRVFMPCGYLCPAGIYALRVLTPEGCRKSNEYS
ncbi:MAG: hypothetical protein A2W28_10735 [Gammaproteobacteria bacterium RBG_16_51_14]|nr:MAG: hypothetical protein A2W28_10735 [Gammaproteobacteria bacterium RBG_16_51_14]